MPIDLWVTRLWVIYWGAALTLTVGLSACAPPFHDPGVTGPAQPRQASEWPHYGGDAGGQRNSPLDRIHRENVQRLEVAWTFHTGDVARPTDALPSTSAFENTPILVEGRLFLCTPFNRVIALDIESGEELWRGRLPAGGQATPMTYEAEGAQYVVIAAGGHGRIGSRLGDALVAFRLPE